MKIRQTLIVVFIFFLSPSGIQAHELVSRKEFYSTRFAGRLAALPEAGNEDQARRGNDSAAVLKDKTCTKLSWDRVTDGREIWFFFNHLSKEADQERKYLAVEISHVLSRDNVGRGEYGTHLYRNSNWYNNEGNIINYNWNKKGYIPDLDVEEFVNIHRKTDGLAELSNKVVPPAEWHASPNKGGRSSWDDRSFWTEIKPAYGRRKIPVVYSNNFLLGFYERDISSSDTDISDTQPESRLVFGVRSDRATNLIVRTFSGRGNPDYLWGEYEIALYGACIRF